MKLSKEKVELELVRRGKTWNDFTKGIGVTRVNICNLFHGKTNNLSTVIKVCKYLKVDVLDVIEDEKS